MKSSLLFEEVCCSRLVRPWPARARLVLSFYDLQELVWMLGAHSYGAIQHRHNKRTLNRARLKDYESRKKKYGNPLLLAGQSNA